MNWSGLVKWNIYQPLHKSCIILGHQPSSGSQHHTGRVGAFHTEWPSHWRRNQRWNIQNGNCWKSKWHHYRKFLTEKPSLLLLKAGSYERGLTSDLFLFRLLVDIGITSIKHTVMIFQNFHFSSLGGVKHKTSATKGVNNLMFFLNSFYAKICLSKF